MTEGKIVLGNLLSFVLLFYFGKIPVFIWNIVGMKQYMRRSWIIDQSDVFCGQYVTSHPMFLAIVVDIDPLDGDAGIAISTRKRDPRKNFRTD